VLVKETCSEETTVFIGNIKYSQFQEKDDSFAVTFGTFLSFNASLITEGTHSY